MVFANTFPTLTELLIGLFILYVLPVALLAGLIVAHVKIRRRIDSAPDDRALKRLIRIRRVLWIALLLACWFTLWLCST